MIYNSVKIQAFELENIFKEYEDNILIGVSPSYLWDRDEGSYTVCMVYKKHKKKIMGRVSGLNSSNRCALQGLIAAAEQIKQPKPVGLLMASSFGFEKAIYGKGINAPLWKQLFDILEAKGCPVLTGIYVKDGSVCLKTLCLSP